MYKEITDEEIKALGPIYTNPDIIWAVVVDHPLGRGIATAISKRFGPMPMITTHEGKLLEFFHQEADRLTRETGLKHTVHRYIRQDF